MREPEPYSVKAWAKEYEEAPFYFEQPSANTTRLVAWSDDGPQIKMALYATLELFPEVVEVLLKISAGKCDNGTELWTRFHGKIDRRKLIDAVQANEVYVFSDGAHQLCVKVPQGDHYLAFDDHGIFFIYSPDVKNRNVFNLLGFESRFAEPIFASPHFQHLPENSEALEMKFVSELGLQPANSDLD